MHFRWSLERCSDFTRRTGLRALRFSQFRRLRQISDVKNEREHALFRFRSVSRSGFRRGSKQRRQGIPGKASKGGKNGNAETACYRGSSPRGWSARLGAITARDVTIERVEAGWEARRDVAKKFRSSSEGFIFQSGWSGFSRRGHATTGASPGATQLPRFPGQIGKLSRGLSEESLPLAPRVRGEREAPRRERVGTCIAVIYKFEGRRLTLPDADRQACHLAGFITAVPRPAEKRGSNWVRSTSVSPSILPTSAATLKRIKSPTASAVAPITRRDEDSLLGHRELVTGLAIPRLLRSSDHTYKHSSPILSAALSSRDTLPYFSPLSPAGIVDGDA